MRRIDPDHHLRAATAAGDQTGNRLRPQMAMGESASADQGSIAITQHRNLSREIRFKEAVIKVPLSSHSQHLGRDINPINEQVGLCFVEFDTDKASAAAHIQNHAIWTLARQQSPGNGIRIDIAKRGGEGTVIMAGKIAVVAAIVSR